ncbi:olfactory receptor 6B1-like [Balearica regulorum gibbericeps]|uniref:olfactory receptor 6B1-like n=1 Tax=Balearica regulorum gibbericeps TaxID=100784 RepID=UPI000532723C|nr:PREDICTED: olfactory receptor 6B1-like [Balearica regulorum gibbericeps]
MPSDNLTHVVEFVLVGFPGKQEIKLLLFFMFFLTYVLTVTENAMIVVLVCTNLQLHKPMYVFLCNLSFLEIWYVSLTVPKMLVSLVTKRQDISFTGCMAQLFFFLALACSECTLLAVMAYDRYVAICNPLHYPIIMDHTLCARLSIGSWMSGFLISTGKVYFISCQTYCGPNIINHFFCDVTPLLKLACTNMSVAELMDFLLALLILLVPLIVIMASYAFIISAVFGIPSAQGCHKAFSTCASHLLVVIVFYTVSPFIYARPQPVDSFSSYKLVSVVYTVLTLLVNLVIYCLRNQEFKTALRKTIYWRDILSQKFHLGLSLFI